jgi:hypothetical protein
MTWQRPPMTNTPGTHMDQPQPTRWEIPVTTPDGGNPATLLVIATPGGIVLIAPPGGAYILPASSMATLDAALAAAEQAIGA